jgi:hypothetical protein
VDTIATNPNQADDRVGDPAAADIQTLLITAAEAVCAGLDRLSGPQLIGTDAEVIADGGPRADQPDRPHRQRGRDGARG